MTPIYLFGPTAVGKTDLALVLANTVDGEIINMDVGSFYEPLSIGVAKPDWRKSAIRHHMFDIITEPRPYDVVQYANTISPLIANIQARGKVPIVVGGSGFYLRSLFFPPQCPPAETGSWSNVTVSRVASDAWRQLYAIDSVRATQIHPHDTYRIHRALEVCKAAHMPASAIPIIYNPRVPHGPIVCLYDDRQILYDRINRRVSWMLKQGLIEEAERLFHHETWKQFLYKKKLIGYVPLFDYFLGKRTLLDAQELIQKQTRRYAKRQLCFWRMLQKMFRTATTECQVRLFDVHVQRFDEGLAQLIQVMDTSKP